MFPFFFSYFFFSVVFFSVDNLKYTNHLKQFCSSYYNKPFGLSALPSWVGQQIEGIIFKMSLLCYSFLLHLIYIRMKLLIRELKGSLDGSDRKQDFWFSFVRTWAIAHQAAAISLLFKKLGLCSSLTLPICPLSPSFLSLLISLLLSY